MEARTPTEILSYVSDVGLVKAQRKISSVMILAFFAGVSIAFAANVSNMAAFNLYAAPETYGLAKALAGALFGAGLMIVILGGGELFTGNMLIVTTVLDRRTSAGKMFLNWLLVWTGNLAGGLIIAWMTYVSGLFNSSGGLLGGITITIAASKTSLAFFPALVLGILCNWLVCFTVWTTYAARDAAGKVLIIFFLILLFAASGFEHSIANMYYIPAGIFAKQNPQWLAMSQASLEQLAGLNWFNFFVKNLIPVTLGNIIGGALVGIMYWFALGKNK
ncbi:MAG: formate/nitrite transporter family protein [Treponema sp.]|jgi:formate/nitrite transporter|nr:formate/nitrite transporter family protein [Treponema sp.]